MRVRCRDLRQEFADNVRECGGDIGVDRRATTDRLINAAAGMQHGADVGNQRLRRGHQFVIGVPGQVAVVGQRRVRGHRGIGRRPEGMPSPRHLGRPDIAHWLRERGQPCGALDVGPNLFALGADRFQQSRDRADAVPSLA